MVVVHMLFKIQVFCTCSHSLIVFWNKMWRLPDRANVLWHFLILSLVEEDWNEDAIYSQSFETRHNRLEVQNVKKHTLQRQHFWKTPILFVEVFFCLYQVPLFCWIISIQLQKVERVVVCHVVLKKVSINILFILCFSFVIYSFNNNKL